MTIQWLRYIAPLPPRGERGGRVTAPYRPEQGLTLIECLVAIVIVGLVVSSIAPALVLSVATRVQSQKAEQALKLAQTEIDRVRTLVERREATEALLPLPVDGFADTDDIVDVGGPNYGALVAENARPTKTQTRPVDINGDKTPDFAVQIFRSPGLEVGGVPVAFALGVRVYDIDAVNSGAAGSLLTDTSALSLTSGLGQRRQRPLAALYTTVAVGDGEESLCNYITFLDPNGEVELPQGCTAAPALPVEPDPTPAPP